MRRFVLLNGFERSIQMQIKRFDIQFGKQCFELFTGSQQVLPVTPVRSFPPIGAAILVVDQTYSIDGVDFHGKLDVLQHHLVVMHAARQGDDVEIIIPKANGDPRLDKFL